MRKGMCGLLTGILVFFFAVAAFGIDVPQWAATYGGSGDDFARAARQTADGGYIVVGKTKSFGAGDSDALVMKLRNDSSVEWQRTFGGTSMELYLSADITQTSDGGYIMAGDTRSFGTSASTAGWVIKLGSTGAIEWQKKFDGDNDESISRILETSDGGYIAAGTTKSASSTNDAWLLKLTSSGAIDWQKAYGAGSKIDEEAFSVRQTSDGGYVVAGYSAAEVDRDFWVFKVNASGAMVWQKVYGGAGDEVAYDILETADGGFLVAGSTTNSGAGGQDAWILKLTSAGAVTWQKTYGGTGNDWIEHIVPASDGGYVVSGMTWSFGTGMMDIWVMKLAADGSVTWQKTYGGTGVDWANSLSAAYDGGYVVAGGTYSFGSFGGETSDILILKLNSTGSISSCSYVGTSSATIADTSVTPADTTLTAKTPPITGSSPQALISAPTITPAVACGSPMPTGNISVAITVSQDPVPPGVPITYTATVTNLDVGTAYSVTLTDAITKTATYISAVPTAGTCEEEQGVVTCLIGDMAAGATATVTIAIMPGGVGLLTNQVFVASANADTDPSNNTATVATSVQGSKQKKLITQIVKNSGGKGSITSGDGYISCPGACSHKYYVGTEVALTAVVTDTLTTFKGWLPASLKTLCPDGTETCTVTVDKAKTVKAVFDGPRKLKVTVQHKKKGSGAVTSDVGEITCPGMCKDNYKLNDVVTLTANPDLGSAFTKWLGKPCSKDATNPVCEVTMNNAHSVTAVFTKETEQ